MPTFYTFDDRIQDAAHAAVAALKIHGVDMDTETVKEVASNAAGEYSSISIMKAVAEFFRVANQRKVNQ